MDDRLGLAQRRASAIHRAGGAPERIHGLAHVVEIGLEEVAERFARRRDVDIHHAIAVLDQLGQYRAAGLAAAAGHDDAFLGHCCCFLQR
jgi:hypothetical protein